MHLMPFLLQRSERDGLNKESRKSKNQKKLAFQSAASQSKLVSVRIAPIIKSVSLPVLQLQ